MLFSSLFFLYGFLPAVLVCYYLTPARYKNYTLLLCSYLFYAWGSPLFALILLVGSAIDFWISHHFRSKRKKWWLALSLLINLALLGYFKYANFFVDSWSALTGFDAAHWTRVVLPIGISFWTFQKISYVIDVYRKETRPARRFSSFALYIVLFPQLIAGPIVRYHDIAKQLKKRVHTARGFLFGLWRFSLGLGKKVLIADYVGTIANQVFSLSGGELSTGYAWLGILAYAMQIYFDFSGYSDMAIGLSKMFGFDLLENFNAPYIARSFTDFWRRWHISLSRFMREYLYIPLGGNRVTTGRMYLNLWIVFLLSGLWHGAAWTFILWGAFHGFFLFIEKAFLLEKIKKVSSWITVPVTFFFISLSWVLFRAGSIGHAAQYYSALLVPTQTLSHAFVFFGEIVSNRALAMLIIALFLSFIPAVKAVHEWWSTIVMHEKQRGVHLRFFLSLVLIVVCTISLAHASYQPFIYFTF